MQMLKLKKIIYISADTDSILQTCGLHRFLYNLKHSELASRTVRVCELVVYENFLTVVKYHTLKLYDNFLLLFLQFEEMAPRKIIVEV